MERERWVSGYTAAEIEGFQERFGLRFPPDLIDLLRDRRLAEGHDWNDEEGIRSALDWPLHGLLFDVENNDLWWPEWGRRPEQAKARAAIVADLVARAPRLIPILGHRYLPATPCEAGNPVFSVHQSDIIHYGADLDDYLVREFEGWSSRPWPAQIKPIPFWSEFVLRG